MELRTLRYFVTVVREGSITAAAKSLHVTQPTLSRQLAALEDELGHLLYQRNRKGIELTEQGVILRRYAESILALADKAEEEIALPTHSIAGKVHIAAGETQAMELVAEAMSARAPPTPASPSSCTAAPRPTSWTTSSAASTTSFWNASCAAMWTCTPCAYPTPTRGVSLSAATTPCSKGGRHARGPAVQPLISSRQGVKVGVLGQGWETWPTRWTCAPPTTCH